MCGIFGYVGQKTDAPQIVLEGLKKLEYRGYDSWGVAVVPDGKTKTDKTIFVKKKTGKIGNASVNDLPAGTLAFGHTRWATHGGVTDINAHPHLDCTKTIAVIHNGIVENYQSLKKMLVKAGHTFISETDTEVIAHLIEEYAKKLMFSKAVQQAFNALEGLNAVIVIHTASHQLVAARNGSPLVVGYGDKANYLASDPAALLPYTKQVHFLEDDEMAIVEDGSIRIFHTQTGVRIRPRKQVLTWSFEQAEKGKYPYFMLKEIHEQPGLLSEIASETPTQAALIADLLKKSSCIYVIGSGTAGNAARAATQLFAGISSTMVHWEIASEFDYRLPHLPRGSTIMALSQSGETMDLLEVLKHARKYKFPVLALVNVVGSSLWRMADIKLPLGAGPEKGVASTKAFITKIAHLILIAHAMEHKIEAGKKLIAEAAKAAVSVTRPEYTKKIAAVAEQLKSMEHIYVIGRGLSYSAALESALKIKEISYIHAEGLAAGELKHGPLALVTEETPCLVIAPNDEHYGSTITNAREMKARGGMIIGISPTRDDVFDIHFPVADIAEATIIPTVMVAQLLAYYLTIERGYDPDMPRNLAKSVTVK